MKKRIIKTSLALIFLLGSHSATAELKNKVFVPNIFVELSAATKVPADILYALAVQESNTKMNNKTVQPWPFTIHDGKKGKRYANYEDMVGAANQLIANGQRSIDIGWFQVNWRWHGHRVKSVEELSVPWNNGIVASQILIEQYNKHKNWAIAAGRYHNPSNTDGLADKYQDQYLDKLKRIQNGSYQKTLVDRQLAAARGEG